MDIASTTALRPTMGAGLVFDPTWRSFSSIQGGLVVGHLLEAAAAHAGAAPRAVTAHLLGGVASGVPAHVGTASDREGRTGSVRSEMWQDGGMRAVAQVLTPPKGMVSAATLLSKLHVAKATHALTYQRSKFKLWADANKDGRTPGPRS